MLCQCMAPVSPVIAVGGKVAPMNAVYKYYNVSGFGKSDNMMTTDKATYRGAYSYGIFRRMLVWLCRMRHSRGFGVHSPWAYRMVRYVINEHYPYYAYESLALSYPHLGRVERKVCELCLRLANSVQPSLVVSCGDGGGAYGAYFGAGCRKARMEELPAGCSSEWLGGRLGCQSGRFIVRLVPGPELGSLFAVAAAAATAGSAVIVHGIYTDATARREWRRIVSEEAGVVTFDLYYCGLVFFDEKLYKQNYIINF